MKKYICIYAPSVLKEGLRIYIRKKGCIRKKIPFTLLKFKSVNHQIYAYLSADCNDKGKKLGTDGWYLIDNLVWNKNIFIENPRH